MPQLGKYSTDRDNILHYMATCGWANDSFGDVDAPTGYVWRMSNNWEEVKPINMEITSLIEDQLEAYDIVDSDEFRESLVGHFLIVENSNGSVDVWTFDSEQALVSEYNYQLGVYEAWDSQDED